ncbi:phosphoglycerate dehydrogenase [Maridesulfovibrio zosterae]|uniref:phosphoglycerate dehydrogenase n=1 Tax=Maridesulfovibrio zosterae TaxID=82171 RepID=UPI000427315D|nr:phosphoglycerate dehydrogenase [Maridesulfovibrio zosterae]
MSKTVVFIQAPPYCAGSEDALNKLREADLEIIDRRGQNIDTPGFMDDLCRADVLLNGNDLQINSELMDQMKSLKMIGKYGVGLDMVDIPAATERNIAVCNSPGCNCQAVADQTLGMILGLMRMIPQGDSHMRQGKYDHTSFKGTELWKKTLGLVGVGAIGRAVAMRANGFKMRILGYDPYWPAELADALNIERIEKWEEMLPKVDVLSLHCNLTKDNAQMLGSDQFKMMKKSSIVVNAARGELINEDALYEALKSGEIAGAGIDAWTNEPPTGSPLLTLDNVLAMPHSAAFTVESFSNMDMQVTDQIIDFSRGIQPRPTVNNINIG